MVAKVAVIIIAIGAAFGALLVNRQQRIDVVAEVARSQLRMELHAKTITRLQAAVADAVRPSELRVALGQLPIEWEAIPNRFDPLKRAPARAANPASEKSRSKTKTTSPSRAQLAREHGG